MNAPTTTEPVTPIRSEAAANEHTAHSAGPIDQLTTDEVMALLSHLPACPGSGEPGTIRERQHGARRILQWLMSVPGTGWQARWTAAGTDGVERPWMAALCPEDAAFAERREILAGLGCLLQLRLVLPTYDFLCGQQLRHFFRDTRLTLQPEVFGRIEQSCAAHGMVGSEVVQVLNTITKIVLHTGKDPDQLTAEDLLTFRAWMLTCRGRHRGGLHGAWDVLRDLGLIDADATLRATLRRGQPSTAELVDAYRIQNRPIRDLLVRYLDERRPSIDFSSFRQLVTTLAGTFWADIEQHTPGIDTIDLPDEVATAWKQRLQLVVTKSGAERERITRLENLIRVRSFYLDVQEWAHEDSSWVPWAVRCPIRRGETDGIATRKRAATSRAHQRIRERLPHLDVLVDVAETHRTDTAALATLAAAASIGDTFDHNGVTYRRVDYASNTRGNRVHRGPQTVLVSNIATGEQVEMLHAEEDAFWSWAIVEILRHTGVRVEELLELTHLSLVSYRLPGTGEVIPLLQIMPSKGNEERLLLVTPELASVLATVVTRVRGADGRVPLAARYDPHERVSGPPLPHLLQRRDGRHREMITAKFVFRLLTDVMTRSGLRDRTGEPLRYTPRDFRRIFATEAVTGGLPVHIAARLLGHHNINTTQGYLAVFQDELISSYRAYLDHRRAVRPNAEYREPTEEEWNEFQKHFEYRKVELGTCGRPYGTPCQHEHACLRCPSLRPDPRQRSRLVEIIRNLGERIAEARTNGWHGEIEGLQISLDAGTRKLLSLDRLGRGGVRASVDLGMPRRSGGHPTGTDSSR